MFAPGMINVGGHNSPLLSTFKVPKAPIMKPLESPDIPMSFLELPPPTMTPCSCERSVPEKTLKTIARRNKFTKNRR